MSNGLVVAFLTINILGLIVGIVNLVRWPSRLGTMALFANGLGAGFFAGRLLS